MPFTLHVCIFKLIQIRNNNDIRVWCLSYRWPYGAVQTYMHILYTPRFSTHTHTHTHTLPLTHTYIHTNTNIIDTVYTYPIKPVTCRKLGTWCRNGREEPNFPIPREEADKKGLVLVCSESPGTRHLMR